MFLQRYAHKAATKQAIFYMCKRGLPSILKIQVHMNSAQWHRRASMRCKRVLGAQCPGKLRPRSHKGFQRSITKPGGDKLRSKTKGRSNKKEAQEENIRKEEDKKHKRTGRRKEEREEQGKRKEEQS